MRRKRKSGQASALLLNLAASLVICSVANAENECSTIQCFISKNLDVETLIPPTIDDLIDKKLAVGSPILLLQSDHIKYLVRSAKICPEKGDVSEGSGIHLTGAFTVNNKSQAVEEFRLMLGVTS